MTHYLQRGTQRAYFIGYRYHAPLCNMALRHSIEVEYVQLLIRSNRLLPG